MTRKTVFVLMLLATLGGTAIFVSAQAQKNPTEKPFVPGGRIDMQLDGGDYDVRPGAGNTIRVTLSGNTGNAKVAVNVNGTHADIAVKDTPHNNFHATIEVPATSDLRIRLTAGNLATGAIRGSKDIESAAGNMEITVGDLNDYFKADGSVNVGNLDADPFDKSKGGFFRSFKWSGHGKYQFHAHVGAGNLSLRR
jgi:hypothetical protein